MTNEWIFPGLVSANGLTVISGRAGCGKTTLVKELCRSATLLGVKAIGEPEFLDLWGIHEETFAMCEKKGKHPDYRGMVVIIDDVFHVTADLARRIAERTGGAVILTTKTPGGGDVNIDHNGKRGADSGWLVSRFIPWQLPLSRESAL